MSPSDKTNVSKRQTIGWILVCVTAGLMALNHTILIFGQSQPLLFLGYAAFNLYALAVAAIPLRRQETWAWFASWMLPIGLAIAAAVARDPAILGFYLVTAAIAALGLLLTAKARQGRGP